MKTLPVAVQVYSVRDDAARDFKGTMLKLKEIGYDGALTIEREISGEQQREDVLHANKMLLGLIG